MKKLKYVNFAITKRNIYFKKYRFKYLTDKILYFKNIELFWLKLGFPHFL